MSTTDIQLRGHCQACGRIQAAAGGIAKHGYTVEGRGMGGWFKGGCPGAGFPALELSRERLDWTVEWLKRKAAEESELEAALLSGKKRPTKVSTGRMVPADELHRRLGERHMQEMIDWDAATEWQRKHQVERDIFEAHEEARRAERDAKSLLELAERVHGQPLQQAIRPTAPTERIGDRKISERGDVLTLVEKSWRRPGEWKYRRGDDPRIWAMNVRSWRKLRDVPAAAPAPAPAAETVMDRIAAARAKLAERSAPR